MPIASLKNWLFDRSIKKEIEHKPSIKKLPVNPGKNLLLLYDCTDQEERHHLQGFRKNLIEQGKSVVIFGYYKGKLDELNTIPHEFISDKQTNWYRKPEISIEDVFPQKEFDLLINLDRMNSKPVSWLAAHIPARLKAAFTFTGFPEIYDLVFDEPESLPTPKLIERLRRTLLSISTPRAI